MGTRSTLAFKEDNKILVKLYVQYDGYPDGYMKEVAKFISSKKLVNGISPGQEKEVFNGFGCLAAQVISYLKNGTAGGYYITTLDDFQEYNYEIELENGIIKIKEKNEAINLTPKEYLKNF